MRLLNDAEAQASGTTVTTGNTGDANSTTLDEAVIGANMTLAFDNAAPAHGSNAFKLALTSTATAVTYVGWSPTPWGAALAHIYGAFYFRTNVASIASSIRLVQFRSGGTVLGYIGRNNGTLGFHFRTAADAQAGTISAAVSADTWYRVEFDVIPGGTSNLTVYVGDSTTSQGTAASLAGTIGGTVIDGIRFGCNTANFSSTSGDYILLDSINVNDVGLPGPGPYIAAAAAPLPVRYLPRRLGPRAAGPLFFVPFVRQAAVDIPTAISDSDSGTATETSDVQATIPGSDSGTGTDAGTVSATISDSDSGTGTDAQVSIVSPVAGSDTATGTDTGAVSVTAPGSDSSTGADTGSISVTASSSDTSTGTDAGTANVTAPGSDSGTGTDNAVVTATDPGGEAGAGTDSGVVNATIPGSDSGVGTDTGSVADITGGPTPISDSDSGTGSETSSVVDLTPPPTPGGGAAHEGFEDLSEIDFRIKTGADYGHGTEIGVVVDLTPKPRFDPLRIILPRRKPRAAPESSDTAAGAETGRIVVMAASHDLGRFSEASMVVDLTAEEEDERFALRLLELDI